MTDVTVTDEMVDKAARAIARLGGCGGYASYAECCETIDDNCDCGKIARAALDAVVPMVVAGAKEQAAKIADELNEKWGRHEPSMQRTCMCTAAQTIALHIRATDEERERVRALPSYINRADTGGETG